MLSIEDVASSKVPALLSVARMVWLNVELSVTMINKVVSIEDATGADVIVMVSVTDAVVPAERSSCVEDDRLISTEVAAGNDDSEPGSVADAVIKEFVEVVSIIDEGGLGADVSEPIAGELWTKLVGASFDGDKICDDASELELNCDEPGSEPVDVTVWAELAVPRPVVKAPSRELVPMLAEERSGCFRKELDVFDIVAVEKMLADIAG